MKVTKTTFTCDMCRKQVESEKDVYPEGWHNLKGMEIEIPSKDRHVIVNEADYCGKNCFLQKILTEVGPERKPLFGEDDIPDIPSPTRVDEPPEFPGYHKPPCPEPCPPRTPVQPRQQVPLPPRDPRLPPGFPEPPTPSKKDEAPSYAGVSNPSRDNPQFKKPFWKKKWFIFTVIAIVVVIIGFLIYLGLGGGEVAP